MMIQKRIIGSCIQTWQTGKNTKLKSFADLPKDTSKTILCSVPACLLIVSMNTDITPNNPPFPAFRATETGSFAWDSTVRRWPIILDSAIKDVQQTVDESNDEAFRKEGNVILDGIKSLKAELAADKPLRQVWKKKKKILLQRWIYVWGLTCQMWIDFWTTTSRIPKNGMSI